MTQGRVALRSRVLDHLVDAGTWVSRDELAALSASTPAIEDAIADLVADGIAEHQRNVGYRVAASVAARRALQLRRRGGKKVAAAGMPTREGGYRLALADTLPGLGCVTYELELPPAAPGIHHHQALRAQAQAALDFINSRGGTSDA